MRYVLGGSTWRSRKAFRCGRARGEKDQRVRLYRYCRAEAFDSTRLSGESQRRRVDRYPTVEWSVWKVLEVASRVSGRSERSARQRFGIGSISWSNSELNFPLLIFKSRVSVSEARALARDPLAKWPSLAVGLLTRWQMINVK